MRTRTPWVVLITCLLIGAGSSGRSVAGSGPRGDCSEAETPIDRLICGNSELSDLDRQLAATLAAATAADLEAGNAERARRLAARQDEWESELENCMGDEGMEVLNPIGCVQNRYELRIAGLQVDYAMVPEERRVTYLCDGEAEARVVATYFATDRPTVRLQRRERSVLAALFRSRPPSGPEYLAKGGVSFRPRGDAATIEWPPDDALHCRALDPAYGAAEPPA